jgi:methenyltetrahydromethanopterin cyclohydrolase
MKSLERNEMLDKATLNTAGWPSVNLLAYPLVQSLIQNSASLRIGVEKRDHGPTIIDAGIHHAGSLEAGRLIAEICMSGLGHVQLQTSTQFAHWPFMVSVHASHPVLACLGSQYAGWSLSHDKFFSLGSGPARAIACREDLFQELGYTDKYSHTCLVLESDEPPPDAIIEKVSRDTGVKKDNLVFILTPTRSLAGTVQIVSRVLEVALHKVHALHFPLSHIVDGMASAPLPPPSPDFITGMGRTNDAILFGGHVHLFVKGSDEAAKALCDELPSINSKDFGQPFAEVFKAVNMDFYQIDPLLFSPAKVTVTALDSGRTFNAGHLDADLIDRSFGFIA